MYCQTHGTPLCPFCVEEHSRFKDIIPLSKKTKDITTLDSIKDAEQSLDDLNENIRKMETVVKNHLEVLQEEKGSLQVNISQVRQKINNHLDKLEESFMNEVSKIEEQSTKSMQDTQKDKQAQIIGINPKSIHDIKSKLIEKFKITTLNTTGCDIFPDKRMVFSDYRTSRRVTVNTDQNGKQPYKIYLSASDLFDVMCINNNTIAVTTGTSNKGINIVDIESKTIKHNIPTEYRCHGITHYDGSRLKHRKEKLSARNQIKHVFGSKRVRELIGYGCYCGWGGSGTPVDGVDRKVHKLGTYDNNKVLCIIFMTKEYFPFSDVVKLHDNCYGRNSNCSPKWKIYSYSFQGNRMICKDKSGSCKRNALCNDCKDYHSLSKASKNHETIGIDDFQSLSQSVHIYSNHCSTHNDKYQMYCQTHDTSLCLFCVEEHSECKDIIPLSKKTKDIKTSDIWKDTEQSLVDIDENIDNMETKVKKNIKDFGEQKGAILANISRVRQEINNHLDKLEKYARYVTNVG
ncbi:PLA2G [Mytilus coruscus]|uniref:PLA2G n=1 Tax=Mytilus coruscus TaxID=42192 RepID=A0A6J8DJE7_MYTCO|nr:PLA2G [Mytilus coruscus]